MKKTNNHIKKFAVMALSVVVTVVATHGIHVANPTGEMLGVTVYLPAWVVAAIFAGDIHKPHTIMFALFVFIQNLILFGWLLPGSKQA